MHYSGKAFGLSRLTIKTKDPAMQNVIGRTNKLSELDIKQMNLLYNCNGRYFDFINKLKELSQYILNDICLNLFLCQSQVRIFSTREEVCD